MNQEHKIVLYQVEDTNIYVNVVTKGIYVIGEWEKKNRKFMITVFMTNGIWHLDQFTVPQDL